jgi:hypothetical protein
VAHKPTKPNAPGSVSVSVTLQKWLVISFAASVAGGLAWTIYTYTSLMQSVSWAYAWQVILINILPLVFFAIAFVTDASYPRAMNRWFTAALKATIALTVVGLVQTAESIVTTLYYKKGYSGMSDMIGFDYIHYGLIGAVLVVFILLCIKRKHAA